MNKKGFSTIFAIFVAVLVVGGVVYMAQTRKVVAPVESLPIPTPPISITTPPPQEPQPPAHAVLTKITPSSARVGDSITITGKNIGGHDNIFHITKKDGSDRAIIGIGNNITQGISFKLPASTCVEYLGGKGGPCPREMAITPGEYFISYLGVAGESNKLSFTVLAPSISSNTSAQPSETKIVTIAPQDNHNPAGNRYVIVDKDNIVTLGYDQEITNLWTLNDFENNLTRKNFLVPFPEKQVVQGDFSIPTAQSGEDVKVNFTSYQNGRLKGNLTAKVKQLLYWIRSSDPNCRTGDQIGVCVKTIPTNIDLRINFDFKIQ